SQLWDNEIGSLEAGKRADIVVVDTSGIEWQPSPLDKPIGNLVYSASGASVRTVLIDGRLVMKDRQMLLIDEAAYVQEAKVQSRQLFERLGVTLAQVWPHL